MKPVSSNAELARDSSLAQTQKGSQQWSYSAEKGLHFQAALQTALNSETLWILWVIFKFLLALFSVFPFLLFSSSFLLLHFSTCSIFVFSYKLKRVLQLLGSQQFVFPNFVVRVYLHMNELEALTVRSLSFTCSLSHKKLCALELFNAKIVLSYRPSRYSNTNIRQRGLWTYNRYVNHWFSVWKHMDCAILFVTLKTAS